MSWYFEKSIDTTTSYIVFSIKFQLQSSVFEVEIVYLTRFHPKILITDVLIKKFIVWSSKLAGWLLRYIVYCCHGQLQLIRKITTRWKKFRRERSRFFLNSTIQNRVQYCSRICYVGSSSSSNAIYYSTLYRYLVLILWEGYDTYCTAVVLYSEYYTSTSTI